MRSAFLVLFLPLFVAVCHAAESSSRDGGAAASIAAQGFCGYSIVVDGELSPTDAFVLEDMNSLLARSTGIKLPVVDAKAGKPGKRIFFAVHPEGFDVKSLCNQEHVTVIRNGDIYLFGGGTNGTRYAAYDFLQHTLGFRFFDPRGGVGVPDLSEIRLADSVRRRKFSFEDRGISSSCLYTGRESALFLFRNGVNCDFGQLCQREKITFVVPDFYMPSPSDATLVRYLPANSKQPRTSKKMIERVAGKVGGDLDVLHPEYFSLKRGKRVFNHQRCLSNSKARSLLKEVLFERIAELDKPSYIDLSAGDTPGAFCECDGCRELEHKYGTPAGPLLDTFLEFCPLLEQRYPQHTFITLAYRKEQGQKPPVGLERLPENFAPRFAPINDDFSKDWNHPSNQETFSDLKEWCRLCRKVFLWYYPNPYGSDFTPPLGNLERLAVDIALMKEAGVTGTSFEHNVGVSYLTGFTELQSYVMLRMFADSKLDHRVLRDEFLAFEYGPAAKGVREYLEELEALRKSTKVFFTWDSSRSMGRYDYLTAERLVRWRKKFAEMETLVSSDRARSRNLRRLRLNLELSVLRQYKKIRAKFPDTESVAEIISLIRLIAAEILEDAISPRYPHIRTRFKKALENTVLTLEVQCGADAKPLPKEIFGSIDKDKVFVVMPVCVNKAWEKDEDAAFGRAAVLDENRSPNAMKLPFVAHFEAATPRIYGVPKIGRGVDAENLGPAGKYKFYDMGKVTLTPSCFVKFAVYPFQARLDSAYIEGAFNEVRVYASLKFEGENFYPGQTGTVDRVYCDRVVVVHE